MNRCQCLLHRLSVCLALMLAVVAVRAAPMERTAFFEGQGSLVYDAATGDGAWLGTFVEAALPAVPAPLDGLSSVSFSFDDASRMLVGVFEFTSTTDFADTLFGRVRGELLQGGFDDGGKISVDYAFDGGTGQFAGMRGFGVSLLDFAAPVGGAGGFSDYTEAGVVALAVDEPANFALAAAGLLAVAAAVRRRRSA